MKTATVFEDTVAKLTALAESLRGVQELGVAQFTPIVETILRTRSRDVRHIEQTLDSLLDIACHQNKSLSKDFFCYLLLGQNMSDCITGTGLGSHAKGFRRDDELPFPTRQDRRVC